MTETQAADMLVQLTRLNNLLEALVQVVVEEHLLRYHHLGLWARLTARWHGKRAA